ncbi:hypothetical protein [Chryseosolibacter indicus]|uniref:Uncharacterized protein n=1 Tax=Chryseosolibacter indicus TaxID=2782351 RepID=A0ABS5VSR3_9BACT|nr:hypothetical protein [Chryseosolibacter indicus]MBT1704475.1 hypothetical protein [Chryseosolibacter indicus]
MLFDAVKKQIKDTREEILGELNLSLQKRTAIGIFIKDSGDLITTAVVDIEESPTGDHVITLMKQDLHGYPVEQNPLHLSNIERVIRFNIPFDDPQYVIERRKEKFKA